MENKQQIIEELSKAGIDPELETKMARLESRRITPETQIPQKKFLFRMFGKPCFPRGELVAITGKKKCGKTFFSSILMTLCMQREFMSMQRIEEQTLHVLWIDTEQSEESTQEILVNRILAPLHQEGGWEGSVFNLRAETWNERLPLIEIAAHETKPDLIIFDGIRDVVDDINDGVMAQEVLERVMHLASDLQCCVCCVLHQNKSLEDKTLRGALGTELGNKCFEEYECKKDGEHRLFQVEQVSTRKYDIMDKLTFTVTDDGLPRLLTQQEMASINPPKNSTKPQETKSKYTAFNRAYIESVEGNNITFRLATLFADAMPKEGDIYMASEVQQKVMDLSYIQSRNFLSKQIKQAIDDGIIIETTDDNGHTVYYRPLSTSNLEAPSDEPL